MSWLAPPPTHPSLHHAQHCNIQKQLTARPVPETGEEVDLGLSNVITKFSNQDTQVQSSNSVREKAVYIIGCVCE